MTLGIQSSPRGMNIKELLNASFMIQDTTNPWTLTASRKLNYRFGVMEGLLNLCGEYPAKIALSVNKKMESFMNKNTGEWDGNYPKRIFPWLEFIYETLKKDPDSRRAVIPIYGNEDRHESLDICCTETIQFMIRGGRLHMIVNMRSNDVLLGTPNDVVQFTILQKFMAAWLGVAPGMYWHNAGSLHAYERDFDRITEIVNNKSEERGLEFPSFPEKLDFYETLTDVDVFWAAYLNWLDNSSAIPDFPEPFHSFFKIMTKSYGI